MSTNNKVEINPDDWISAAEAARLRGVSRQAINKMINAGRISTVEVGGRKLLKKSEVISYQPLKSGRPKTNKG